MNRIAIITIISAILVLTLVSGCTSPRLPPPLTEGVLTLSDSPVLGRPLQVTYTLWLSDQFKWDTVSPSGTVNVTANIELSNKFELIAGSLQWQGTLAKGKKAELKATIKAVKKGTCEITASSEVPFPSPNSISGGKKILYVLVLTDRGYWSDNWNDLPGEGGASPAYAGSTPTTDEVVITPHLSILNPPPVGHTAELTLVATAILDAPGARISVELPKELQLMSGNLQWNGNMTKGDLIELKGLVKATKAGKWVIQTSCS